MSTKQQKETGQKSQTPRRTREVSNNCVICETNFISVRKSKCCTEPSWFMMEDQTSSVSLPLVCSIFLRCLFLTLKDPVSVFWVKAFALYGSIPGEVFPAIMVNASGIGFRVKILAIIYSF